MLEENLAKRTNKNKKNKHYITQEIELYGHQDDERQDEDCQDEARQEGQSFKLYGLRPFSIDHGGKPRRDQQNDSGGEGNKTTFKSGN